MPAKKSPSPQPNATADADATHLSQTLKKTQILNTQQSLQKYLNLYQQLKAENEQLRLQLRSHDEDHVQVSGFLQTDVEQRTNTINKLQQEVFEQKRRAQDQIADLQQELKHNEKKYQLELQRREDVIKDQEQTLLQFERVKRERQILEDVLQQKEKEIIEIRKSYENKITLLQLQFVEQKVKLQQEGEELKKSLEEKLNERAMEMLGIKSQEIHHENQKLHEHQEKIQKDLTLVAQLKESAVSKSIALERDNDLQKDTIRSQAKRGMQLAREVKELRAKVKNLQETLTNVVNKHLQDKKTADQIHETDLSNLRQELEEMRTLLKVRTTELVNLKKLAKRVVSNRTELERFFMEALSEVKRFKEEENLMHGKRQSTRRKPTKMSSSLPPLGGGSTLHSARSATSRMSDASEYVMHGTSQNGESFEHLTWEDKEKVLKLLFKKINGVQSRSGTRGSTNTIGGGTMQDEFTQPQQFHRTTTPTSIFSGASSRLSTPPAGATRSTASNRFFVTEGGAGPGSVETGSFHFRSADSPNSPGSFSYGLQYAT